MPRVLHVAQPVDGGVPRAVGMLVADQVARGWEVHVAAPAKSSLVQPARAAGAQLHRWEAGRSPGPGLPLELWSLATTLRVTRPDCVHLHSSKAGLVGRMWLRGRLPTLFSPHGWSFNAVEGIQARLARLWEQRAARWAAAVVCASEAERADGERAGVQARYRVVENGVDLERFRVASPLERDECRRRLGLAGGPLVVCIGRIVPAKGQRDLVEAWPRVAEEVPGARLVLVGDGPDAARIADRPGVALAGHQDDVWPWLAAADVVVLPSHTEAMSLAVLEAMAVGRSVVATDTGGSADALGGGAGAVVPVGDLAALAARLVERLRDPELAQGEGQRAAAVVRRRFAAERWAGGVAAVVAEVARDGQTDR